MTIRHGFSKLYSLLLLFACSLYFGMTVVEGAARKPIVPPLLIPQPQHLELSRGELRLPSSVTFCLFESDTGSSQQSEVIETLRTELKRRFGYTLPQPQRHPLTTTAGTQRLWVMLPRATDCKADGNFTAPNDVKALGLNEGYVLESTPSRLALAAGGDAGMFYGVQTLLQLFSGNQDQLQLPAIRIADYPDVSFRGVHLVLRHGPHGRAGTDMELFDRVLKLCAALKLNRVILQIDHALQYASHPELNGDVPVARLKASAELARRHFIEIIPQLEAYGHQRHFIFQGGTTHQELGQKSDPNAYCACDDKVYQLFFDLWNEVLPIFKPRYAHIGHDEVAAFGDCAACGSKPNHEILAYSIGRFHEFFKRQGVRAMLWGDMLLDPARFPTASYVHGNTAGSQAFRALEKLPRDLAIIDWHYREGKPPKDSYPTTKYLKQEGFEVFGAPRHRPWNIYSYTHYIKRVGGDGMVVTTWAAFNKAEAVKKDFMSKLKDAQGIITGGDYFWNADGPLPDHLPYDPIATLKQSVERGQVSPVKTTIGLPR